jgi:predicted phosphohydrolase
MADRVRRLLVTADLHYGNRPQADLCTRALAGFAGAREADALALAGDIGEREPDTFATCLELFSDFDGPRLLVPGNHDVWRNEADSREKYEELLPRLAQEAGFHMLDDEPRVIGDAGFVGSIGWYDYSMRNPGLGLTLEQYAGKRVRGVATWNDLRFVDWPWSDEEFTERCLERLQAHYEEVAARTERVLAFIHHLPFSDLLYGPASTPYEFCRAYMGSVRFGELMTGWPKLEHVFCGHRHGYAHLRTGGLDAWCVGSEYGRKRLLELDLETGACTVHAFTPADGAAEHAIEGEVRPET